MSLEDVPCGHVVVAESVASEEGCDWALSQEVLNRFPILRRAVWTHLSATSADDAEDASVAHWILWLSQCGQVCS